MLCHGCRRAARLLIRPASARSIATASEAPQEPPAQPKRGRRKLVLADGIQRAPSIAKARRLKVSKTLLAAAQAIPSPSIRDIVAEVNADADTFLSSARKFSWAAPTFANKQLLDQAVGQTQLAEYRGKTILEMNPGPGIMTEAVMDYVQPSRYICLEPRLTFHKYLSRLTSKMPSPDALQILPDDGYDWATYKMLEKEGYLRSNEYSHPRTDVNPHFIFLATPAESVVDQLLAQWMETLGTQSWLQRYGRVRMLLLVNQSTRARLMAPPGSNLRTRGTFVREAVCDVKEIVHTPWILNKDKKSARAPWIQDFKDTPQTPTALSATPQDFFPMSSLSMIELTPFAQSKITAPWETFDYICKTLLIHRTTPLYRQMRQIAAGAYKILEDVSDELKLKKPTEMTAEDMNTIAEAFERWPFRPDVLQTEALDAGDAKSGSELRQYYQKRIGTSDSKWVMPDVSKGVIT